MPIVRKIIRVGQSKAVSLPKSWLEYYEKENDCNISEVGIEVNSVLKIFPILPKRCFACGCWIGRCTKGKIGKIASTEACEEFHPRLQQNQEVQAT